ncbi:MAG: hypothetical protein ACKPKO_30210, partial [Candidatus Fonsibacter sp.]
LVVVHEDADVVEFDVGEDIKKKQRMDSVSNSPDADETAFTRAPSEEASSEVGTKYACMNCKEDVYKSGFLLCDDDIESHDWAGTLWGKFEECSNYPQQKAFKKGREGCMEETQRRVPVAIHSLA